VRNANQAGASLMPINSSQWQSWPIAPRETTFSADDAIARLQNWANGSAKKFNQGFLYRVEGADPKNPDSYRLPLADVVNGKLTLIPRAVFSAGVIMSGGHGGLYDVLSDADRDEIRSVLTRIYDMLGQEYSDPRVVAPWLRGNTQEERDEIRKEMNAAINASWDIPVAPDDTPWNAQQARARVWSWADRDIAKYAGAFLWHGRSAKRKGDYKLPVADVIDGQLMIVPRAVSAIAAALAGTREGVDIPGDEMDDVETVVASLQDKINKIEAAIGDDEHEESEPIGPFEGLGETEEDPDDIEASAPVRPPADWFTDPRLNEPTPLTVTADGRVFGHGALFNKCHAGIGDTCVMAPRNVTGYKYFKNGQVLTADGKMVKIGKITMGTGHAGTGLRGIPAAAHYDNTGTQIALVNVGEDRHGIWLAGSVVPGATEEQIAELRRSPVSGDWRRMEGRLELVAALAVNTPGFPIVASLEGSDEVECIIAAGVLLADGTVVSEMTDDLEDNEVEAKLRAKVDALDEKITRMLAARRARTYDKMVSALTERGK
jgi:hypothetical protein